MKSQNYDSSGFLFVVQLTRQTCETLLVFLFSIHLVEFGGFLGQLGQWSNKE